VEGRPRHGTRDYEAELRLHNAASYWPSWSSDGTLIVYTRFVFAPTGQPDELFTMRPDGTGDAPLVRTPGHAENEADRGVHP
jgi:hypothetical protein